MPSTPVPHAPATATLTSNGTSTATLAQPSGFGQGFGQSFGGLGGAAGIILDSDGTSSVVLAEVPALVQLQLA